MAYKKLSVELPMPEKAQTSQGIRPKFKSDHVLFALIFILTAITMVVVFQQHLREILRLETLDSYTGDYEPCHLQLVESIPEHLNFSSNSPKFMSTYNSWKLLLNSTESVLNIGSFYWTLLGSDVINDPSAGPGEDIFNRLTDLGTEGKIKIRIAQSVPSDMEPDYDTQILQQNGAAEVRSLNFTRLLGGGVLHTKFWISDHKHVYLGSANMDWRSLTQVKEMGVLALNCPTLANDLEKIFEEYWMLSTNTSTIPEQWPSEYATEFNFRHPMHFLINDKYKQLALLSSSPPALTASGRVDDISAILQVISSAKEFVNIAVMDYIPMMIYSKDKTYWPIIDDALRSAAIDRKIKIKLLISWWKHSNPSEDYFLRSLQDLSKSLPKVDIQIKRFIVPSDDNEPKIPFGRVNHNKYMVTDNVAYIGTSNWSGDYFTNTAGIGLVLQDDTSEVKNTSTIRKDLLSVFERDWNSKYAFNFKI
ncbi:LOW QUALITY PROTEIN: 5'-3' exonuclease PLD3-like [Musca vetustissima]|uniref:LOW QUALITY PROTEIN: 5'-3' exonuclease PLD3-like n=1 Tax=Musca vetustissima TaxID=27455 RepID=UPI002AB780F8|nr:LOW QUALITY PROTEIN: 5'-3' exonuclease PLD3-like [Musca vetustissima]